ncbi:hypothetical protein [Streptomyces sp. NPDC014676]|uniref:hypothetical protein n=1 Tax=Streptomyces sp. NPDC014676 TaxID=3364879 RepID=UPI0036FEF366
MPLLHGEGQGDRRDPVAEQVGRRTDEEVTERAVAQRRQGGRHAPDRRDWAARPSTGLGLAPGQVCGCPLIDTLADAFAYASAAGVTLRIDGTELQVRRPRANKRA